MPARERRPGRGRGGRRQRARSRRPLEEQQWYRQSWSPRAPTSACELFLMVTPMWFNPGNCFGSCRILIQIGIQLDQRIS